MTIFVDSAIVKEVEDAKNLGWVHGVTTNPLLLANAGGEVEQVLSQLARLNIGPVFYQLISTSIEGMCEEMERAAKIIGPGLVLKVPATQTGLHFVSQCRGFPCCVTAVFNPAQALVASEAGARYVAVYVQRAVRLMGSGLKLVREVASILKYSETEIIAASLKSADEACDALTAGAHHLTLPYGVLTSLMADPFTEQTLVEFRSRGIGIPVETAKEHIVHFHDEFNRSSHVQHA